MTIPACVDINLGNALPAFHALESALEYPDDYMNSCMGSPSPDVVFYWVAPAAGTYAFYAEVDAGLGMDVASALFDACDGIELICDDDGGDGIDTRIEVEAAAGEAFLWIVSAYGDTSMGFAMSVNLVP